MTYSTIIQQWEGKRDKQSIWMYDLQWVSIVIAGLILLWLQQKKVICVTLTYTRF